jgi:hypothetical protein
LEQLRCEPALRFNVCFGSKADIRGRLGDVRFTPKKQTYVAATGMSALCQKRTCNSILLSGRWPRNFAASQRLFLLSKTPITAQDMLDGLLSRVSCGGRVVLNNLSEQMRECLQHAEDCARKAAAQPDGSPLRQDYLEMEKRWLSLSRSIELGERLDDFAKNSPKPKGR